MNKVTLFGRIGTEIELKKSKKNGSDYIRVSMVTTERRKGDQDKWYDHQVWHQVVIYGSKAKGLNTLAKKGKIKKGTRMLVEGKLDYYTWEDKHGEKRTTASVQAIEVTPIF